MVDALALGASEATHGGSSPLPGTSSNLFGIKNMERFCGSQRTFARKVGEIGRCRYNTLIKMESGENKNPTSDTLKKVAKALVVSVDDLIN